MKKFNDLSLKEFEQIINRSKVLRDKLNDYIQDSEMDFLSEKLDKIKSSLKDWSVGFYNQNFIKVGSYENFLDCVIDYRKEFGCSDRMEKLIPICEKLRRTNLFEYFVKQLEEMFIEDEIKTVCDYVESASNELYCGEIDEKSRDYLECFKELLNDYLFDDETETFHRPTKLDVA